MEYVKLGPSGLKVSRICLGCMSYGSPGQGNHAWSLSEDESRPFIRRALEGGPCRIAEGSPGRSARRTNRARSPDSTLPS